ncbi:hypothetical protein GLOIN_2v1844632 [Rhizophagus irregularis DAOM 181602=DAOM 197198]|uniref:Uncharacterized protein n=1 Tax=Rhizophagus irregularis (strain DAOM 181602 / DAOM 197198 / MUCL 43194) TaxID=747089 RepID=A0A2P4PJV0_RHIID|nr:hypothetical protein GLOIN_2v1844632 [Rhizophagus irregularis DAOM 181602=DAOM 197198]POG65648.1 hypothetical protein GLOIN_2v1844632 [Rhizophagus irregularis DAOM 181602=DAOM 197198]|eukprot:XP_025172514.1 hypothetical protein GLOIN_2v1844632 [Rhizophagus irregularis DAOM 181602=DAOM 197198]
MREHYISAEENTNFFTSEGCYKKFLSLMKAFYMTDKYKKGTGNKELSWEGIYKEFSTKFWLKPELPFDQASIQRTSRVRSLSHSTTSRSEKSSVIRRLTSSVKTEHTTLQSKIFIIFCKVIREKGSAG